MDFIELLFPGWYTILGVILAAIINKYYNKQDFEKKKYGAELLIKSEIRTNVEYLKKYYIDFLNTDFESLKECGSLQDLDDFYYNLKFFPIISHKYWDKLIGYAPEIFKPTEIESIIKFFIELDKLNQHVEIVHDKEYDNFKKEIDKSCERSTSPYCLEDFLFMEIDIDGFDEIISVWRGFELKFKEVLQCGEDIIEFMS